MGKSMTWQQCEEEYGIDFEEIYQRRLGGAGWRELEKIANMNKSTVMVKLKEYCADKGRDYKDLSKVNSNKIIEKPEMVDQGKAMALWRAGWSIKNIAIDCRCTEECVLQIVRQKGE